MTSRTIVLVIMALLTGCAREGGEIGAVDEDVPVRLAASTEDLARAFEIEGYLTDDFMRSNPRVSFLCHDFMGGALRRIGAPLPDSTGLEFQIFAPEGEVRSARLKRTWRSGQEREISLISSLDGEGERVFLAEPGKERKEIEAGAREATRFRDLIGMARELRCGSVTLVPQTQSPAHAEIEVAVASAVLEIPSVTGSIVLDGRIGARPFETAEVGAEEQDRDSARVQAIATALGGAWVGRAPTVVQCGDNPSTCRMVGAETLLVIDSPEVDGAQASVLVHQWTGEGSARQPVVTRTWRFDLEREGDVWRVVERMLVRIS